MRITHATLRYPPASGGVEEYVRNLVVRLRTRGDDVTVETTSLRTHHPPSTLPEPLGDPPYVHRHPVRTFRLLAYPIPRGLHAHLSTLHPHLIHAHGFWYAPADIAARVAHRRRIPFVLNPYYSRRRKALWSLYRTLLGARTIARADAIVVISPQEEALLRADGFRLARIELIPPGIDPAEFATPRPDPFAGWGIPGPRRLLFVGRITQAKGIDLLLEALPRILREVPDARLALIGEDFGDRAAFEALTRTLGVEHAVTWLGKIPRAELLAAYAHATVVVLPSRYEAFGIAALEAQASGRPVVATNTASLPYVVREGEGGFLFRPEESADLAAAILRLLRDPALAQRCGTRGRERVSREFSWDGSLKKLRALYAELM